MNANIKSGRSPTTPSATPVKKGKKRTERDDDEGDETDDAPKKSRGSKRKMDLFDSDDSEEEPKKKDRKGKVKGKRKPEVNYGEDTEDDDDDSHKPRPGRQRRKPAKYVDDDDTEDEPMPRKSTKRKREATNKSKKRKRPSSTFDEEELSDTEETAPWTSDDDGPMPVKKVRKKKKRGANNDLENEAGPSHRGMTRESESPAASGAGVSSSSNCNTNVRPRRNVRPKVVQDSETENEEHVNMKIKKKSSQGRARRQATEKAKFRESDTDDDSLTKNRGEKASMVIRSDEEDIDEAGSLAVIGDDEGTAENVVDACENTSDSNKLEMSDNKTLKRDARTASKFPKRENQQLESSNVSPLSTYPSLPGSSSNLPTSSSLPMYTSLPGSSHEHSADGNASSSGRPQRAKTLPPKLRDDDVITEDVRKKKMSKKKSSIKKSNEWLDREVDNLGKSPKKKTRKINSTSSSESNSNRVAEVNSQIENELKSDKSNHGASQLPETESQVGDSYEGFESEGGYNAASRSQRTAKSNIKYVDESGSETSLNKLEKKQRLSKTKKIGRADHRNLDESSEGEMYDPSAHVSSRPGRTSKLKCKKETSEVNDEESDGEISRNVRAMEPDIEQSNAPIQGRSPKKKVKKKRKQNLDAEIGVSGPEVESDGDAGTLSSRFGRSIKTNVKYREPESESEAEARIKITKRKSPKKKYEENDVVQELDAIVAEESEEDVGHISSRSGRPIKANIKYIEGDSESDNIKDKPPKKKTKKKKTKSKDLNEESDVNFSDGATQDDIGHSASRSGRTIKANVKYNEGETESDIESKDKPSKKKIKKKMSKPKYVEESDGSEMEIGKISSRSGRTVNANIKYVEGDSESDTLPRDKPQKKAKKRSTAKDSNEEESDVNYSENDTLPRDKPHKKKAKNRSIAKDSNEEESDVNYSEEIVENGSAQVSSRSGRPIKANVKYVEGESESDIAVEVQANKKKSKKKRFSEKESESREFESDSFPSTKRKRPKKTTNEQNGHVPDRSSRPRATVKYNDDTEDNTDESDIHPAKRRNIGKSIEMAHEEEPEQLLESDSRDNNELKSEDFEDSSEGETSDSENVPLSQRKPRGRKRRTSGGVGQVDDVLANLDALDSVLSNLHEQGPEDEEDEVEEEGSSSDYGKRRGRKRDARDRHGVGPRFNTRPQRAGGFSRNNLRESTDEDLPPKRARSQRIPPISSRPRGEDEDFGSSSTSDEYAEAAGGISSSAGVSSRGRVRKPNPKHL